DTVAVYLAMQEALEVMRSGGGPTVIEADTYRHFHQNGPFPGSAFGYRTKDEEQSWKDRDPIAQMDAQLRRRGLLTDEEIASLRKTSKKVMSEVAAELVEPDPEGKPGTNRIRPELWPDPGFIDVGIRGPEDLGDAKVREIADFAPDELE